MHAVKQFHLSGLSDAVGKNGDLLNLKCSVPDNALGQILRGISAFRRGGSMELNRGTLILHLEAGKGVAWLIFFLGGGEVGVFLYSQSLSRGL